MNKIFIQSFLIIICATTAFAQAHKGKSLYQYGNSASALGRAGTGVSAFGTDLFYLNPASIAEAERLGLGLQYGTIPLQTNYYNPEFSLAVPTSYGSLGLSYRYFNFPDAAQFASGGVLSFGGAKDFTERVMIGAAFNIFYGSADSGGLYYFGGTIGSIYKIKGSGAGKGFGLFDTNAGFALNFGVPFGSQSTYSNFNNLTIGLNSRFYRGDNFKLGAFLDMSAIDGYSAYPIKAGFEADIKDNWVFRAGGIIPIRDSYDYGDFTLGAGYKFQSETYAGSVNYAFNYYRDNTTIHYIGATFEYGRLDRMPPVTMIKPDQKYISPNHDGIQDHVFFETDVKDESRIAGWKFQIADENGKAVKEYKKSDRVVITDLTVKLFFKRLFQKKESMVVPEKIMWDGTGDDTKLVSDGTYSYSFLAWDGKGNISDKKAGIVAVDNTQPEVKLEAKDRLFSPNGDKQKDELIIAQSIKASPEDEWIAGFKNSSGKAVKSYKWSGDSAPAKLLWDGKDDAGNDAPEGLYYYFIKTTDNAGNAAAEAVNEITLTRAYESADVSLSSEYFSHRTGTDFALSLNLSKADGLESWSVTVYQSEKNPVRSFNGAAPLPKSIAFDGKDDTGKNLDDGIYFIKLTTKFDSGNTPASYEKKLIIDSTPPKIKTSHSPNLFSPDNDGENDILSINTDFTEKFGIRDWKMSIYESSGMLFKTFSGKGDIPKMIFWDGLGDDKEIVESASEYTLLTEATDMAGNKGISAKDTIEVDILVIVTERGLKIKISNIHFDFDSDRLKKQSFKILDRVDIILQKYGHYKVEIEGHTDDIGTEEYNLKLSERRAISVQNYLIKKGIDKKRLTSVGRGKTVPNYDVSKEKDKKKIDEMRRKNRRVEFLLIKIN